METDNLIAVNYYQSLPSTGMACLRSVQTEINAQTSDAFILNKRPSPRHLQAEREVLMPFVSAAPSFAPFSSCLGSSG